MASIEKEQLHELDQLIKTTGEFRDTYAFFWFLNAEFENSVQDKAISAERQKIESQWHACLTLYIFMYL